MRALSLLISGLLSLSSLLGCAVHHHYPLVVPSEAQSRDDVSECAPLLPPPDALASGSMQEGAKHSHHHKTSEARADVDLPSPSGARVIPHAELKKFENDGAVLIGLATASMGASDFEVWRSSVPPGGATPIHVHDTEEVFVVLEGEGVFVVAEEEFPFVAPATVIAPANVPHQLKNTGETATDQIVIVGVGSEIKNQEGTKMELPWRK